MIMIPFDAYEISMVHEFLSWGTDDDNEGVIHRCESGAVCQCELGQDDKTYWSLYGHIPGQGAECIGDFKSEADAREILARILGRDLDGECSPFPLIYGVDS